MSLHEKEANLKQRPERVTQNRVIKLVATKVTEGTLGMTISVSGVSARATAASRWSYCVPT